MRNALLIIVLLSVMQALLFAGPEREVNGIVGGDTPRAIVNGKLVKEGDTVDGATVEEIGEDFVVFRTGGRTVTEYLKKGAGNEKTAPAPGKAHKDRKEGSIMSGLQDMLANYQKAKSDLKKIQKQRDKDFKAFEQETGDRQ
jgi:hypothetical protein